MLNNLLDLLCDEHNHGLLERFRERVCALEEKASDTGWGYSDYVSERLAEAGLLDDESEGSDEPAAPDPNLTTDR